MSSSWTVVPPCWRPQASRRSALLSSPDPTGLGLSERGRHAGASHRSSTGAGTLGGIWRCRFQGAGTVRREHAMGLSSFGKQLGVPGGRGEAGQASPLPSPGLPSHPSVKAAHVGTSDAGSPKAPDTVSAPTLGT